MNNIESKLVRDGSEQRRNRLNLTCMCIGGGLFLIGAACLALNALTGSTVDAEGVLHENFFLLPIGFLFMLCSLLMFAVTGIRNAVSALRGRNSPAGTAGLRTALICMAALLFYIAMGLLLVRSNAGADTMPACILCLTAALAAGLAPVFMRKRDKEQKYSDKNT